MFISIFRYAVLTSTSLTFMLSTVAHSQALSSQAYPPPPSRLALTPTPDESSALQNLTNNQMQQIQTYITPRLQQKIQNPPAPTQLKWKDIIGQGSSSALKAAVAEQSNSAMMSGLNKIMLFTNSDGKQWQILTKPQQPAKAYVNATKSKSAFYVTP